MPLIYSPGRTACDSGDWTVLRFSFRGYGRSDGMVLFNEFGRYDALADFTAGSGLALVVHGDRDSYVSCPIARDAAQTRAVCDFHLVDGSDHGFDSREREDEAIAVTAAWLADRSSRS